MKRAEDIRSIVKERYGAVAAGMGAQAEDAADDPTDGPLGTAVELQGMKGHASADGCCGSTACCGTVSNAEPSSITGGLYTSSEVDGLPPAAVGASLGCGNPTALTELHEGEVVLDLGSGGGIDVLLSARRVGPTGKAYGLDMTGEMLTLARENQARSGLHNVEFIEGHIEDIPLPDATVDVIISNCVINLSGDKRRVLQEAFRVLKPGGRFAVSDVVVDGELPAEIRRSVEHWVGCVAGALEVGEFRNLMAEAGFSDVEIEPTRVYGPAELPELPDGAGLDAVAVSGEARVMAAFIRGRKENP